MVGIAQTSRIGSGPVFGSHPSAKLHWCDFSVERRSKKLIELLPKEDGFTSCLAMRSGRLDVDVFSTHYFSAG